MEMAKKLAEASEAFFVPLRGGDGFDEGKYKLLCEVLRECAATWADQDAIPKLAANIFIDLYSAVESCAGLYDEQIAQKIREAADALADLARECVAVVE